jgi:hypothetical protein
MYFDGSLKLGGAGVGVLFISPDENNSNMFFKYSGKLQTMKQNMKHSSTHSGYQSLLE